MLVQSRVMTHEGLLPLFMWTRPTPVGERLWLWLRPGLPGRDIDAVTDRIAAACWAASARVKVSPKRAAVVSVEVIRRDPFTSFGDHLAAAGWRAPRPTSTPTRSSPAAGPLHRHPGIAG